MHRSMKVVALGFVATITFACTINTTDASSSGSSSAKSSKVYCTKNTASGACRCDITDPGTSTDWEYVESCDSLGSGAACCYDVNGDGETSFCDCAIPFCAKDTDTNECYCRYFQELIVGNNRDNEVKVASCTSTICCKGTDSCDCRGSEQFRCGGVGNDVEVKSCSAPTTRDCKGNYGGAKTASSCSGLKWKAK
jgi:hypothetical protein